MNKIIKWKYLLVFGLFKNKAVIAQTAEEEDPKDQINEVINSSGEDLRDVIANAISQVHFTLNVIFALVGVALIIAAIINQQRRAHFLIGLGVNVILLIVVNIFIGVFA